MPTSKLSAMKLSGRRLSSDQGSGGSAQPGDVLAPMTATNDDGGFTGTLALTGDAAAANVLAGKTFYKDDAKTKLTGAMTARTSGHVVSPAVDGESVAGRLYMYPAVGYWDGNWATYYNDPNYIAANIPLGMALFGLAGTGANVKRFASGSTTSTSSSSLTISGLPFSPNRVFVKASLLSFPSISTYFWLRAGDTALAKVRYYVQYDLNSGVASSNTNLGGSVELIQFGTNQFTVDTIPNSGYTVQWIAWIE